MYLTTLFKCIGHVVSSPDSSVVVNDEVRKMSRRIVKLCEHISGGTEDNHE